MSVTDTLCALECEIAQYSLSWDKAGRYGNFPALTSSDNHLEELTALHYILENNNLIDEDDCFDNCELNKKLEKYGLPRL